MTAPTRYFVATTPDGVKVTRQSKTRVYRFAICARHYVNQGTRLVDEWHPDGWQVIGFSGDLENACKTADSFRCRRSKYDQQVYGFEERQIVEAVEYPAAQWRQARKNGELS